MCVCARAYVHVCVRACRPTCLLLLLVLFQALTPCSAPLVPVLGHIVCTSLHQLSQLSDLSLPGPSTISFADLGWAMFWATTQKEGDRGGLEAKSKDCRALKTMGYPGITSKAVKKSDTPYHQSLPD